MPRIVEFLRSHKILGVLCGFLLLILGLILSLPGVPGPGIALILLGLFILSSHYSWAKRLLDWAKRKWHRVAHRADNGPQ